MFVVFFFDISALKKKANTIQQFSNFNKDSSWYDIYGDVLHLRAPYKEKQTSSDRL
jgi:hypothetical protein